MSSPTTGSNPGFMTESEVRTFFSGIGDSRVKLWLDGQDLEITGGEPYSYSRYEEIAGFNSETIIDEWYKWYVKRENGTSGLENYFAFGNPTLPFVYFVEPLPFQRPDFERIIIRNKGASLLIPIYAISVSTQEYPSRSSNQSLLNLIKKDLFGIDWNTVRATFDGTSVYGRCVIRSEPLPITGIPPNSRIGIKNGVSLDLLHGGFWLLIRADRIDSGDHFLYVRADSKTYESEAKILINARN
jgi:hypothetical protein